MTAGKIYPLILTALAGTALFTWLPIQHGAVQAGLMVAALMAFWLFMSSFWPVAAHDGNNGVDRIPDFKGEMRLAASLREAIIIINERQQIEHINPAAHILFPDIRTGSSITTVMSNPKLKDLTEAVLSGRPAEPYVFQVPGHVERHFRVTASPLQPGSPDVTGAHRAILIFYDVTDLERSNALRADFLANASHELKTPIASLLGYIETLNGHAKDDPEARTRFLGIMQQQAERMQRLIKDILSLRRIELSEHKAPSQTADLYLAFLAAAQAIAPMAEQRDIRIDYEGPKELLVFGQQDELVQLILNIIDNGVKMSPENSTLQVTGQRIDYWEPEMAFPDTVIATHSARRKVVTPILTGSPYGELRLRDHGPGFSGEHLPRLSERFYRVAGDRSSDEKGTGLGLAIVKHIVLRHRGGLMIETAENEGTEFSIIIPAVQKGELTDKPKSNEQVFVKFAKPS